MEQETDINKLLADAAERIRREGYVAGWRDAMAAAGKAIADLPDDPDSAGSVIGHSNGSGKVTGVSQGGPTQGSTPWYVLQAIKRRPGMTGVEVVGAVQESGHDVSEGSIRTSIARLRIKKLIVARHAKWFPA